MNSLSHRSKVRSYIFDVPTRSHLSSICNEDSFFRHTPQLSQANFSSKFELIKQSSRVSEAHDSHGSNKINPSRLNFSIKFLPYINAQNGHQKTRSIIASIDSVQLTESLPLIRKKNEINFFDSSSKVLLPAHSVRNKSVQVSGLKKC